MRVVSRTEAADHVFSAISKEEVEPISTFLQSKGVRLKNEMDEVMEVDEAIMSDEDDDMDDASIPSEDEGRRKGKGKEKTQVKSRGADDDDDESGASSPALLGLVIHNPRHPTCRCKAGLRCRSGC